MALTDAHRAKLTEVSVLANTALATRRDALMQQRARVAARVAEVRAARATIERGTHSLVDDMLSRLRAAEQRKVCKAHG